MEIYHNITWTATPTLSECGLLWPCSDLHTWSSGSLPPAPVLMQQPGCWCCSQAWSGPWWSVGACIHPGWPSPSLVTYVSESQPGPLVERQLLLCSLASTQPSPALSHVIHCQQIYKCVKNKIIMHFRSLHGSVFFEFIALVTGIYCVQEAEWQAVGQGLFSASVPLCAG